MNKPYLIYLANSCCLQYGSEFYKKYSSLEEAKKEIRMLKKLTMDDMEEKIEGGMFCWIGLSFEEEHILVLSTEKELHEYEDDDKIKWVKAPYTYP